MKQPFIPSNAIHLCEAIEIAARHLFPDEMVYSTLTVEENRAFSAFLIAEKAKDPTEDQALLLSDQNRQRMLDFRSRLQRRDLLLKEAWDRLVRFLYVDDLTVSVITDSGYTTDVPKEFWGSSEGQNYFSQYSPTSPLSKSRYHLSFKNGWDHRYRGAPFILSNALTRALKGESAIRETEVTIAVPTMDQDADVEPRKNIGSPKLYDEVELLIQTARLIYEGFIPKNQTDLRKAALDAYQEATGQTPSEEWAKPRIRRFWNGLELERRDKKGN